MNEETTTPLQKKKRFKIPFGTILAAVTKGKKIPGIIKALKAVKSTKALITFISMFISAIIYRWILGKWWFAVGLIILIFIHEMGHVIAIRLKGFKASAPVFIPFFGAAIFMPKMGNRTDEAFIGIGGPILGSIGALVPVAIWFFHPTHPDIWYVLGFTGLYINLFNMLPVRPLDGGRITQLQGDWFKWIGIVFLLTITFIAKSVDMLLIWILILMDLDKVSYRIKFIIACCLAIIMWSFMFMEVGRDLSSLNIAITSVMTIILLGMIFLASIVEKRRKKAGSFAAETDERPYPPLAVRMQWLVWYLLLTILLVAGIIYLSTHAPAGMMR